MIMLKNIKGFDCGNMRMVEGALLLYPVGVIGWNGKI